MKKLKNKEIEQEKLTNKSNQSVGYVSDFVVSISSKFDLNHQRSGLFLFGHSNLRLKPLNKIFFVLQK